MSFFRRGLWIPRNLELAGQTKFSLQPGQLILKPSKDPIAPQLGDHPLKIVDDLNFRSPGLRWRYDEFS
jgi:hypothetical protein